MRNTTLAELHEALTVQHAARRDVVAHASALRMVGTDLMMDGEPVLTADGVTTEQVAHHTTETFDDGVTAKLGIPRAYLRRVKYTLPELYAENVNGWLGVADRKFMVRTFTSTPEHGRPVARALLADSYRIIDNLDVLMASLEGIRATGLVPRISADLSDRRMVVRIVVPEINVLAPTLLAGYRSPFTGETGTDNPTVWAGFVVSNSETGNGAFTITPRLVVQVCDNGMTITKDATRAVHLGQTLPDGLVKWSSETHEKNLALVTAQARDAVATFLDTDYMSRTIDRLEREAGRMVTDPQRTVEVLGKRLSYTEQMQKDILNYFIDGGQRTAGGIMHAVTAAAQNYDTEDAWLMETTALQTMALVV